MRRLKKGDLKFTLDGYKLKGSWVLVRTGGWGGGGGRSWLLIKHRDDWAGDVDITEFAPKSVKSEGNFEDILAADNPAIWESHRPAQWWRRGRHARRRSSSAPRRSRQASRQRTASRRPAGAVKKAGPPRRSAKREGGDEENRHQTSRKKENEHEAMKREDFFCSAGRRRAPRRSSGRAPNVTDRGSELHLRRPQRRAAAGHSRAEPRRAAGRRREPRASRRG